MALELIENGHSFHWEDMEKMCKEWISSTGQQYNTKEVTGLVLACMDNFKSDDPEAMIINDYKESFTKEEVVFLEWLNNLINE
ncbi:hypothetical protein BH11BAC7_BH11BAC7_35040 [soil metagenome]